MFWMWVVLFVVMAFGFFAAGLRRGTNNSSRTTFGEQNVALYQDYLAELQRQQERGEIDGSQVQELTLEAQRKLLTENPQQLHATARAGGGWLVLVVAVTLVSGAVLLYQQLGAGPDLEVAALLQTTEPGATGPLREKLIARLKQRPQHLHYWVLLARLEQAEQRHPQALVAFERALAIVPEDVALIMEYAEAKFVAAHYKIDADVDAIIERALALDPKNSSAHSLQGIDAYNRQDYRSAINHWQLALNGADPLSQDLGLLRASIAQAQTLLGEPNDALRLSVRVSLGAGVLADNGNPLDPATPVFVYAREWQGMVMPLVAQRLVVGDLPTEVILDDSLALSPQRPMSSVAGLELVARVAIGGTPQPESGDIEGRSGPVDPLHTDKPYDLVIDQRVP